MFASGTGSMRGPRVKTPLLLLLLLLLLLTTLTRTVTCQDYGEDGDGDGDVEETTEEDPAEPDADINISETTPTVSDATSTTGPPLPEEEVENFTEEAVGSGSDPVDGTSVDPDVTGPTHEPGEEEEGLSPIIIMIPVVLVVVIIGMIVCGIFMNRRCNQKVRNQELRKEDPYLDGSSTEKVPMPMFEEDVPSVLELEMEELDQWMRKDVEPAEENA